MTETCFLCGLSDRDVHLTLVRFKEGEAKVFDVLPRCQNREACHRRVEAIGDTWPVEDAA